MIKGILDIILVVSMAILLFVLIIMVFYFGLKIDDLKFYKKSFKCNPLMQSHQGVFVQSLSETNIILG